MARNVTQYCHVCKSQTTSKPPVFKLDVVRTKLSLFVQTRCCSYKVDVRTKCEHYSYKTVDFLCAKLTFLQSVVVVLTKLTLFAQSFVQRTKKIGKLILIKNRFIFTFQVEFVYVLGLLDLSSEKRRDVVYVTFRACISWSGKGGAWEWRAKRLHDFCLSSRTSL